MIFTGTWLDDAGNPFDPASFPIIQTTNTALLTITGDGNPSPNAAYPYAGQYAGYAYYEHPDSDFFIWADGTYWLITQYLGDYYPPYWTRLMTDGIQGSYDPTSPYEGNPVAAHPAYGVSRQRIFGRRGGSGSPPGKHHGSALQEATRIAFGNAARRYVDMPPASPETEWQRDGHFKNWLVRSGQTKTMDGQAFYPRTSVPQDYVGGVCDDSPDVTASVSPYASHTFFYDPTANECELTIFSDATVWYGVDGGFSIFQINPKASGRSWERKHTRIVLSRSTWGTSHTGAEYTFTPAWPSSAFTGIRILAIGRNNVAFVHYGPWNSIEEP